MGLDMYLTRKQYYGKWGDELQEVKIKRKNGSRTIPLDERNAVVLITEVGYWRKANAVHKWFVDRGGGEDDCRPIPVNIDDLRELLELCKEVKATAKVKDKVVTNAEEVAELLPTQSGFFFGSTEYDEWYLHDIDDTIKVLEQVLQEQAELEKMTDIADIEYEYRASW